jgi:hypothetical protein
MPLQSGGEIAAGYPARQLSNPFEGAELRCPLSDNLCGILQSVGDQVSVYPIDLPPLRRLHAPRADDWRGTEQVPV